MTQSPDDLPPAKRLKSELTVADAQLYDRQIRLWGMAAQNR